LQPSALADRLSIKFRNQSDSEAILETNLFEISYKSKSDLSATNSNGENNEHSTTNDPYRSQSILSKTKEDIIKKTSKQVNRARLLIEEGRNTASANNTRIVNAISDTRMACFNKKCIFLTLTFIYVLLDLFLNVFFVTKSFTELPGFHNYNIFFSMIDVWIISLCRDWFVLIVAMIVAIKHELICGFVKFVHKKYISSLLCLAMYSFAMIKMLLHADQREPQQPNMIMFIWNIIGSVMFFLSWYMMSLLNLKNSNYFKTDVDGGDLGESAPTEDDIFLGNFIKNFLIQCIYSLSTACSKTS
jgi:hypothetical protein